jgi:hypothetical protein
MTGTITPTLDPKLDLVLERVVDATRLAPAPLGARPSASSRIDLRAQVSPVKTHSRAERQDRTGR